MPFWGMLDLDCRGPGRLVGESNGSEVLIENDPGIESGYECDDNVGYELPGTEIALLLFNRMLFSWNLELEAEAAFAGTKSRRWPLL